LGAIIRRRERILELLQRAAHFFIISDDSVWLLNRSGHGLRNSSPLTLVEGYFNRFSDVVRAVQVNVGGFLSLEVTLHGFDTLKALAEVPHEKRKSRRQLTVGRLRANRPLVLSARVLVASGCPLALETLFLGSKMPQQTNVCREVSNQL